MYHKSIYNNAKTKSDEIFVNSNSNQAFNNVDQFKLEIIEEVRGLLDDFKSTHFKIDKYVILSRLIIILALK